jgi:E3 ubiquitin-protein ligase SIAH1
MSDNILTGSASKKMNTSTVEDALECPVCFKVPDSPPIYQCVVGHMICEDCHSKVVECPTCRQPLGKTRNFVAEKLIEKIPTRCRYAEEGCDVRWEFS